MPTKTLTQPDYLVFECPLTIEAADDASALPGAGAPTLSMVAYTGGVMRIAGFPHPVVDLEGLAIDRQDIPVRLDHNPRQGVGHTHRVSIEKEKVIAEGIVSRDTSCACDVAKSGVKGFPWQASLDAADPVQQMRQRVVAETRRIESIQKICATDRQQAQTCKQPACGEFLERFVYLLPKL